MMSAAFKAYCTGLTKEFDSIPEERKKILEKITAFISNRQSQKQEIRLVYICTHNSRRSHFGQVWAQVAAAWYKIPHVFAYSGGTEATAFNPNAIAALKRAGFVLNQTTQDPNPVYHVTFDDQEKPVICFSKVYDHPANPQHNFAAIMTCGDAEENCPFIPGAELRISTTYDDPKAFDQTPLQDAKYDERCRQIARETFYVFSKL